MNTEYTPIEQTPQTPHDTEFDGCCFQNIICWITQTLIWVMTVIIIVVRPNDNSGFFFVYSLLPFIYIVYVCHEIWTLTFCYLCNKKKIDEISEKMREIFKSNPEISFHYEASHFGFEDKVTSFRESFSIPYYSS